MTVAELEAENRRLHKIIEQIVREIVDLLRARRK